MTVVRSIVGGIELQPQSTIEKLPPTVTSFVLEGIAQNTSGSVFEPEVMSHVSTTQRLLLLHLDHIHDNVKSGHGHLCKFILYFILLLCIWLFK